MNQSESIQELVGALSKAQGMMEPAKFNKTNPHFKNKYADFTSCMEACRLPLSSNGLCIMQYSESIGDNLKLVTMLAHTSGQWIKSYLPLSSGKTCQQLGAEITYMKRYGLSAMLGIVSDEDVDSDDDGESAVGRGKCKQEKEPVKSYEECVQPAPISYISANQLHVLIGLSAQIRNGNKEKIDKWLLDQYKTNELGKLPESSYEKVALTLNNCLKLQEDQRKVNEGN